MPLSVKQVPSLLVVAVMAIPSALHPLATVALPSEDQASGSTPNRSKY